MCLPGVILRVVDRGKLKEIQEACRIGLDAEERAKRASTAMGKASVMLNNAKTKEAFVDFSL